MPNTTVNTDVYTKDPEADPVKHKAATSSLESGDYSIRVLGTDGRSFRPHDFDNRCSVATCTWAIDGHGTAVAFTELGDDVDTAQLVLPELLQ